MNFREKRLLKRLATGDRDACIALIDAHYVAIYRYLLGMCHCEDQAADLTQNTFAKAWQALGTFEARSTFKTWLFGIARNEFLMDLRTQGRHSELLDFTELELVSDDAPSAEDRLVESDMQAYLQTQIATLPGKYREILSLHYLTELSLRDIASILTVPIGTVKSRLSTALNLLKTRMNRVETDHENRRTKKNAAQST